jgi:hypothetical protein
VKDLDLSKALEVDFQGGDVGKGGGVLYPRR